MVPYVAQPLALSQHEQLKRQAHSTALQLAVLSSKGSHVSHVGIIGLNYDSAHLWLFPSINGRCWKWLLWLSWLILSMIERQDELYLAAIDHDQATAHDRGFPPGRLILARAK